MTASSDYQPPYEITSEILGLVAEIGEIIGRFAQHADQLLTPRLRRVNRIKTIQASLAIENNTLDLNQVTAVIEGKRVLGHPREIREVQNAYAVYEAIERWQSRSGDHLLEAHGLLMSDLIASAGRFRTGGVGIYRGKDLVHMAPPAGRVPSLMTDLFDWLTHTREHPLVVSCVFHYECAFIREKKVRGRVAPNLEPSTSTCRGEYGKWINR